MVSVKVCGVRSELMAETVRKAEADFAGLLFVPGRRRKIDIEKAKAILPHLGTVRPVGVFLNASVQTITEICLKLSLQWVQLHGQEPPSVSETLTKQGLHVIRAISVDSLPLSAGFFRPYEAHVEVFLLDGMRPGSGQSIPIEQKPVSPQSLTPKPVWLAGGLNPENVARRLERTGALGADVASGIEDEHGNPSFEKIHEFVRNARQAGQRQGNHIL